MTGDDFVQAYARLGAVAWEAAAVELARQNQLTPWPWIPLELRDGEDRATLHVQADVVAVGPIGAHLRLPLMPSHAQAIANLSGALLPTPWLVYQTWRTAPIKIEPTPMVPNRGANLPQYQAHSRDIDAQVTAVAPNLPETPLVAGQKKAVVVSNVAKPGKVLIFGWYRPAPPFPDVFTDHQPMRDPDRQPIQPLSNVHGAGYVDYSHGIRLVHGEALVNGQPMPTEALYTHPTLSRLVSHEGPLRQPRYPTREMVKSAQAVAYAIPTYPAIDETGSVFAGRKRR